MQHLKTIAIATLILVSLQSKSQDKWFTRNGKISFFSKTAVENIDATNNEVFSLIDPAKNEVAFQVLITGFKFDRALMQEHFNENYMESGKFPKSTFKGVISDPSKVNFSKDGVYNVVVDGDLSIHGVTHKVSVPASLHVLGKTISGSSKFNVKVADYNIKIPSIVSSQISETIEVTVNCQYEIFKR